MKTRNTSVLLLLHPCESSVVVVSVYGEFLATLPTCCLLNVVLLVTLACSRDIGVTVEGV